MKDEGVPTGALPFLHPSSLILHPFFFGSVSPVLLDLREQLVNARRRLLDGVADEMKFGSVLEVEQDTQLPADVRRGVLERLQGRNLLAFSPFGGHVDARVS